MDQSTGLGWATLSIALALPWLVSTHTAPWTMFHAEWLMAAALLTLAGWAVLRSERWTIGGRALPALGVLALLPLAQAAAGRLAYAADGLLGALVLLGVFFAAWVGWRGEALAPRRTADTLFASLVIASIGSTGLMLYQWLDIGGLGMLVLSLPVGNRLVANVGQPNLLATLLVWGLLGLWWGHQRGRIGAAAGGFAAAFLLVGVAATQSRTGVFEVLMLAAVALAAKPRTGAPGRAAVLGLAVWFGAAVLAWPALTQALHGETALSLAQQVNPSRRPLIWRLALDLIAERPWLGWGWNQTVAGQVATFEHEPALHLILPYMHNLALDLMLWFGVPLGLVIVGAILAWLFARWRRHMPEQRPLLLLLSTLLLHSMLELPHAYVLFLLPAALVVGVIEQQRSTSFQVSLGVPRAVPAVLAGVLAVALVTAALDYLRVESDLRDTRMRAARIGDLTPVAAPRLVLLTPFADLLAFLRLEPTRGMDAEALAGMRRVVWRFPSGPSLFRYAQAAALNHQPEEAHRALGLLCHLMLPAECRAAGGAWREIGAARYPEMLRVVPPSP